jgi:hypothetical protein
METYEQPASSLVTNFKFARTLLKETSRGKNPDWYREAIVLDQQLHLFESTQGFVTFLLDRKSQETFSLKTLPLDPDAETLASYFDYLEAEVLPPKARSLGVILHLRSEASVFEFPLPEGEDVDIKALQQKIATSPAEVLKDRTVGERNLSIRIFPTPAAPHAQDFGTAVAMTSRGADLLATFRELGRERNFPIRTHGLGSPMILMARLPRTFGEQEEPFCVMLHYRALSFFGFFTAEGELILLRSLKHVGEKLPHNLESILATTAASIELPTFALKVFDCRFHPETSLESELSGLLLNIPYEMGSVPQVVAEGTEPLSPELASYLISDDDPALAFAETETFGRNIAAGYHLQNFLWVPQHEIDALPGAVDMKLLRVGRLLTRTGLAACLLLALFAAFTIFRQTTSVEWKSAGSGKAQAATVAKELNTARAKEKLLADRSKGWVAMEVFSRLFPGEAAVQFDSANYKVSTTNGDEAKGATAGLVRSWTVEGFARESAIDTLVKLNSLEGMTTVFEEVEAATVSGSVDLSPATRNLMVDMKFSENKSFDSRAPRDAPTSFRNQFTLDIKQRIEKGDSLALPVTQL